MTTNADANVWAIVANATIALAIVPTLIATAAMRDGRSSMRKRGGDFTPPLHARREAPSIVRKR
jgi:hypothetical protein